MLPTTRRAPSSYGRRIEIAMLATDPQRLHLSTSSASSMNSPKIQLRELD
jgi:hypothetical protein